MDNKFIKAAKFIGKMANNSSKSASEKSEQIIRTHVLWSMGAGFIPLPGADFVAVAAVQLDMIRAMSMAFDIDFKETEGKAIISSLGGSLLSRLGATALVKMIPVVGTALGGLSMAIVSGASTYAIGQVFKLHFNSGGSFVDFDASGFQRYYDEQFEKGKKVVKDWKKEADEEAKEPQTEVKEETKVEEEPKEHSSSVIVEKLKELAELKEMGVITDEEFAQMKARLIANYQ